MCSDRSALVRGSLFQVFIYGNEKIADWNALKSENDIEGLKRISAKDPDGISKWGVVDVIIPEKNCDVSKIDLSSTDVINEYRQLLLKEKGNPFIT